MPATPRRDWNREDTLIALRLYCRMPFGRLHSKNPEIIALAKQIRRTPSAVGKKACNFASLDPAQRKRGIKGLANASNLDRVIWAEFEANPESIAAEAEAAYELQFPVTLPRPRLGGEGQGAGASFEESLPPDAAPDVELPAGPTDIERLIRARRVQGFFRATVLTSYKNRCAVTGLNVPELLNASHIIPWSANVARRADPRNGLCLNALLDRAFDRGLFTFDKDLRILISNRLTLAPDVVEILAPGGLPSRRLQLPGRFTPDPAALEFHRTNVFR